MEDTIQAPDQQRSDGGDVDQVGDYTGPGNAGGVKDLPVDLVAQLASLCKKLDARDRTARLEQVARCQKARFFQRGQQYLNRDGQDKVYSVNPITTPLWKQGGTAEPPKATFNIYLGYEKVWISTFSQTPCGVRFEANDPLIERQVEAAKEADSARKIVTKINPQKLLQMKVARFAWTDGLIVFYTRNVTDGSKFGVDQNGEPRSYPEIEVGGALEWKVPITAGSFDEWDYCRLQKEIALSRAKSQYPAKADKIAASTGGLGGDTDFSRQARMSTQEGVTSIASQYKTQSGDAAAVDVTRSYYWLRPSAFTELEANYKAEAEKLFPSGAKLGFIGETYVESRDEDMADHIRPMIAVDAEGFNSPGLGDPAIDPQEFCNNMGNISKDCFERTIPHDYFDQDLISAESINRQKSEYGYKHPVDRTDKNLALGDSFYSEPTKEPPAALIEMFQFVQGPFMQFLTGQQPALFGGQMGKDDKVGIYSQARAMALGLMGLVWIPFKSAWADVMRQAVKILASQYGQGTQLAVIVNGETGKPEVVRVNIDNLKGDFLAYPDTDESYPETWQDEKQQFLMLADEATKNPELGAVLNHPDNRRRFQKYTGIDLTDPIANAYDKQLGEIEEMEKQPPVPDPQAVQQAQAQNGGMQLTPQQAAAIPLVSSVELDEYDDNPTELLCCVDWINDPQRGQKAKRENQTWYQNVKLHADAHKKAVQAAQSNQQQNKPPSESINFKDLPPEGQVQMAAQSGIHLDANALAVKQAADQAAAKSTPTQ